jgi:hypothetical protein
MVPGPELCLANLSIALTGSPARCDSYPVIELHKEQALPLRTAAAIDIDHLAN